ncbi:MAG: hypothetical protein WA118_03055 [Carboxydocellales bacterium]
MSKVVPTTSGFFRNKFVQAIMLSAGVLILAVGIIQPLLLIPLFDKKVL